MEKDRQSLGRFLRKLLRILDLRQKGLDELRGGKSQHEGQGNENGSEILVQNCTYGEYRFSECAL